MKFIQDIYLGSNDVNLQLTKDMINNGTSIFNTYLICIDKKSNNLAEILHSTEIYKKNNIGKNYICIGIANGKSSAFVLFSKIVKDYIKTSADFNGFKNYFC